ncbi:hypothetical protein AAFF_G00393810 [Aldrovandia affinis]|uniref:Uncharacterized protein n=1 Tax=Aldrovandia affinis TaxID=143900 RepID=A0AAD7SE44_9TELE|nr:hypothetical protein AAFF_G00393810 [Aldrovandia affinis]
MENVVSLHKVLLMACKHPSPVVDKLPELVVLLRHQDFATVYLHERPKFRCCHSPISLASLQAAPSRVPSMKSTCCSSMISCVLCPKHSLNLCLPLHKFHGNPPLSKQHTDTCNERFSPGEMMEVEPAPSDFATCDRTGRRNAVPDIKGEGGGASTSDFGKAVAQMDMQAADGHTSAEGESSVMSHTPEGHGSGGVREQPGKGPS